MIVAADDPLPVRVHDGAGAPLVTGLVEDVVELYPESAAVIEVVLDLLVLVAHEEH